MNVYIIKNQNSYKIGKSKNIETRILQLQTACSTEILMIAQKKCDNAYIAEKEIHCYLWEYKLKGEWFNLSDELLLDVINKFGFTQCEDYADVLDNNLATLEKRCNFFDHKTRRLVAIKWTIEGYDNYCFASDNKCYSRVTGWEMPQQLKAYTRGYYVKGRFCSLKNLRPLLRKVETF